MILSDLIFESLLCTGVDNFLMLTIELQNKLH